MRKNEEFENAIVSMARDMYQNDGYIQPVIVFDTDIEVPSGPNAYTVIGPFIVSANRHRMSIAATKLEVPQDKYLWANYARQLMHTFGALIYAVLFESWILKVDNENEIPASVEDVQGRIEAITIQIETKTNSKMIYAEIDRQNTKPVLKEFVHVPQPSLSTGIFANLLQNTSTHVH